MTAPSAPTTANDDARALARIVATQFRRRLLGEQLPRLRACVQRLGGLSMHRGLRIAYYGYKMFLTLLLLPVRRATPLRNRDTVARWS